MNHDLPPGDIRIGRNNKEDAFYILAANRMRAVIVTGRGVAELVGVHRNLLTMGQVRSVAAECLINPRIAYGRIEMCEEMHDHDRFPQASNGPSPESNDPYGLEKDPDNWKDENGG